MGLAGPKVGRRAKKPVTREIGIRRGAHDHIPIAANAERLTVPDEQQQWRFKMFLLYGTFILGVLLAHSGKLQVLGFTPPGFCLMQSVWGLPCPVCGITRSVSSVFHLDLSQAISYHPLGPAVAIVVLALFCYFLAGVLLKKRLRVSWCIEARLFSIVDLTLAVSLLGFWITRR